MKLNYAFHQGTRYEKPETPTLEERTNFFEHIFRSMGAHEYLCESHRPEFVKAHWWSDTRVTKPHACDCWLSEPFGTVGLREDIRE